MAQSQTFDADSTPTADTWQTVNRVVYPTQDADLTLPLYAIEWTRPRVPQSAIDIRATTRNADLLSMSKTQISELVRQGAGIAVPTHVSFRTPSRSRLEVAAGGHASLCTYFNAFPAAYWRYWTSVRTIRFHARVWGNGRLNFFKSNSRGLFSPVGTLTINSSEPQTVTQLLPLTSVIDGGYIWFDAQASATSSTGLTIEDASWQVPQSDLRDTQKQTHLSIAITTFNRERYCLRQLRSLSNATELRQRLDTIYCIDQGTHPVSEHPEFSGVQESLKGQLTYIRQGNLGGSGGFSRGMYESVKAGHSDYTLLLDDDAIIEPEAILRAVQFADYVRRPALIGAGMLHLDNRTMLYTQAERMNMSTLLHEQYLENHDFMTDPLRDSPSLHRRVDSQYNGWWMCLIPNTVIRTIGLAIPVFIKFDDIDYCYRAAEHGFPTISLPGVAIWHQAWHSKDETRSWQEYFAQRNRVLFGLLHSKEPNFHLPLAAARHDSAMGLRFIYSGIALDNMAYRDLLRGPNYLVSRYTAKMQEVNQLRRSFADAHSVPDGTTLPSPTHSFANPKAAPLTHRQVLIDSLMSIARALIRPQNAKNADRPDIFVDSQDSYWQAYQHVSSAIVTSPDGNSVSWLKRNDPLYRKELAEGLRLSSQIVKNWKQLRKAYLSADISGFDTWEKLFAQAK
jgi:galactofuranosylgalactofuranosylrhamnosyl-N-acetylglucosaminyl-diphospho-decaprenol beta-1,5/1,6-galactofuranosyltransferase